MGKEISSLPPEREYKILIVEDNAIFSQTLRHLLDANFPFLHMEEAGNSLNGLRKFNTFHPNLVFVDINLPGSSGLDLTKKIRSSDSGTPIVILTSHDSPEIQETAYLYGANYFLSKIKSSAEDILNLVSSCLPQACNY